MKFIPVGFRLLVEMQEIEHEVKTGNLKGFVLSTQDLKEKEENGHCIGKIVAFGNTCFKGFAGCNSPEDWGVKVGDMVEFNRYDGKIPKHDTEKRYRIVNDSDILMVIE